MALCSYNFKTVTSECVLFSCMEIDLKIVNLQRLLKNN
jgi:hypothetical protein